MIDYISGSIAELTPTYVVIDCSGIGYEINISLIDYSDMASMQSAKLYIHESIREDAHVLYGFLSKKARELFRLLIGVSGVGPNTARLILSAYKPEQLELSIASGEEKTLKTVKGIGAKTAQRIIVDLKDKIKPDADSLSINLMPANEAFDDALAALVMLGFNQMQSKKVLQKLFAASPTLTTEDAIKQALAML